MSANRLKAYFNFSKKERYGIMALMVMLILLWFAPLVFVPEEQPDEEGYALFRQDIEQLQQQGVRHRQNEDSIEASYTSFAAVSAIEPVSTTLFYFDPNTLTPAGWQRLGISGRTIQTIQNFTAKGGRFYKAEDMGKIYGLRKQDYERLLPYVHIAVKEAEHKKERSAEAVSYTRAKYNVHVIPVNTADTTAFIALPGIGSKLANRIINFREKLGGFYTVEQIREVYGVSDSIFQQIRPYLECDASAIKRININTASINELKAHPYVKYQVGNAVIQYRLQHGRFQNMDDLKQVHVMSDDLLQKLEPYIKATIYVLGQGWA
ncbi:helix-hairpin-helix domain-containing protein [Agriterribacter sp.]|uniref:helix-hairpin-helix domain-containing protein n=1 Tax=Agriterribacter sp. TaxID=2821509 RepID=UPI002B7B357E|nr:helix-hairpin-helix domain-containing protein [Agriterribacter sp.]HRO48150.1 helix-hairpin-helix domain-containing protein [Agriterribacter sp.]HRQ16244.1 helix-hairpin-helix domain-containing protein [Agriterribacter sp.]